MSFTFFLRLLEWVVLRGEGVLTFEDRNAYESHESMRRERY